MINLPNIRGMKSKVKNEININQMKKSMLMSVSAQVISFIVSLILNLIVPKYIDEYQYAYWQTFMLYISYVGILHFGLLDGLVLRYSQYDYDELDKPKVRSQFLVLFLADLTLSICMIIVASKTCHGITRGVISLVAVGIVTRNVFSYTSYTFQITNRIGKYAMLVIVQRLFYGAGILMLLFLKIENFYWLCIIDLCSDIVGIVIGGRFNRGLYFGNVIPFKNIITETKLNISSGSLLLVANWASNFLVGSGKMIIQWCWNALIFGKVTFAFSISNLFLNFVMAISVVLFPSIKRMDKDELPKVYKSIREIVSPLLFFGMVFYFPGSWILNKWLPAYSQSLTYLGILLPIIVFSSKVSLLTNNYLKAYRKEKVMLVINVVSIAISIIAYLVCAFIFNSLDMLLGVIVVAIMMRSVISEIIVMRIIKINFWGEFIVETILTVIFVVCTQYFNLLFGGIIYSSIVVIYCLTRKNTYI